MRVLKSVLRWLSAGILVLAVFAASGIPASADTGTYKIDNYTATLEPQSNGQVRITIEQTWEVLSGDIPWVTVGLPNGNYSIENYDLNASKISAANSGGFYGVRIDLDKDYKAGQTFNIRFSVMQSKLLERLTAEKKWRIIYTPGWYDRAQIGLLLIKLAAPVDSAAYSFVSPVPDSSDKNIITWERSNVNPGEKFTVRAECTDGNFLTASTPIQPNNPFNGTFYFIVTFLVVVGGLIFFAVSQNRKARDAALKKQVADIEKEMATDKKSKQKIEEGFDKYVEKKNLQPDEQGRYYDKSYGNYITPAIWAAIIMNQNSQTDRQNSGTYIPLSHPSCACACVSCACACACACAGGGAAGCSRKSLHECRVCVANAKKVNNLVTIKIVIKGE
jgi:hypothetical protein